MFIVSVIIMNSFLNIVLQSLSSSSEHEHGNGVEILQGPRHGEFLPQLETSEQHQSVEFRGHRVPQRTSTRHFGGIRFLGDFDTFSILK